MENVIIVSCSSLLIVFFHVMNFLDPHRPLLTLNFTLTAFHCLLLLGVLSLCCVVTILATDLREHFLPSDDFLPYTLPAFQCFCEAGSSTSKSAGLHAAVQNIAPTQLFV